MTGHNISDCRTNLTNLLNLNAFLSTADNLIQSSDSKYALIVMDISGFKLINDFCSRQTGDELLLYISNCFREYERKKAIAGHFRADLFGLCTPYESELELENIVNSLNDRIKSYPINYKILPAFGICPAQDKSIPSSDLMDYAFMAQKTIKGKYFTNYAFFDNTLREKMLLEKKIENTFDEALATGQFHLYIQPKVNLSNGKVVGGEALVRWIHPSNGIISPGEFIPVLEKNTSIISMDKYIWKKVFEFISNLRLRDNIELPISINISRIHAYDDTLVETLKNLASGYMVVPELVPLELTESAYSENENLMYQKINLLKSHGFLFSMDDFGSGYSTMNMLVHQPVDEVKLDRAFLFHIENPKTQTLIRHSIAMIQDLGLPVVAEGVETEEQRKFLIECGFKYAQGFLFHKPMPAEEFRQLVIDQQ